MNAIETILWSLITLLIPYMDTDEFKKACVEADKVEEFQQALDELRKDIEADPIGWHKAVELLKEMKENDEKEL